MAKKTFTTTLLLIFLVTLLSSFAYAGFFDFITGKAVSDCPSPYHAFAPEGGCVWSCGVGTTPDLETNGECVCQEYFIESGNDEFGRRTCTELVCTDTDGGRKGDMLGLTKGYGQIGSIYEDEIVSFHDKCWIINGVNKGLTEYSCTSDRRVMWQHAECEYWLGYPSTCVDGTCVIDEVAEKIIEEIEVIETTKTIVCSDSDSGKNIYKKGYVSGVWSDGDIASNKADVCGGNILNEYYCDTNSKFIQILKYYCANGCEDGVCINHCYDSDGGSNYYTYGFTETENSIENYDYCEGNYIIENYCSDKTTQNYKKFFCVNGCVNGRCIKEVESTNENCSDTDNGLDYYKQGHILGTYSPGTKADAYDVCRLKNGYTYKIVDECDGENCNIDEYYCDSNNIANIKIFNCPYGCEAGACLEYGINDLAKCSSYLDCPSGKSCINGYCNYLTCTETDNGRYDYENKGTSKNQLDTHIDQCGQIIGGEDSTSYVYESWCHTNGGVGVDKHYCINGCEDGVCLKETDEPKGTCVIGAGTSKNLIYFTINDGRSYTQEECLSKFNSYVLYGDSVYCGYTRDGRPKTTYRNLQWFTDNVYDKIILTEDFCKEEITLSDLKLQYLNFEEMDKFGTNGKKINFYTRVQNIGEGVSGTYNLYAYVDDVLVSTKKDYSPLRPSKTAGPTNMVFNTYIKPGDHTLKIVLESNGDTNLANNVIIKEFNLIEDTIECVDSDIGQLGTIKGITSGYGKTGTRYEGKYLKFTDRCVGTKALYEYSCTYSGKLFEQYADCSYWLKGKPGICQDGRCVDPTLNSTQSLECKDSDNGKNYYFKGEVSYAEGGSNSDLCINKNDDGSWGDTDYEGEYLVEYSCPSSNNYGKDLYKCPNGCRDGACSYTPIFNETNKIINIVIMENETLNYNKTINETTEEINIEEINSSKTENVSSELGVVETDETNRCIDSDEGINPYIPGFVQWKGKEIFEDVCVGNNQLQEHFCDNGNKQVNIIQCDASCTSGACVVILNNDVSYERSEEPNCNGCLIGTKCYPYGSRINNKFCDFTENEFRIQSKDTSYCDNDYECESNICTYNSCEDLKGMIDKNSNFLSKLFDLIKRLLPFSDIDEKDKKIESKELEVEEEKISESEENKSNSKSKKDK